MHLLRQGFWYWIEDLMLSSRWKIIAVLIERDVGEVANGVGD